MTTGKIRRVTEKETGERAGERWRQISAYSLSPGKATCFGENLEAGACGAALSLSKTRFSAQALPCHGWCILPSLYLFPFLIKQHHKSSQAPGWHPICPEQMQPSLFWSLQSLSNPREPRCGRGREGQHPQAQGLASFKLGQVWGTLSKPQFPYVYSNRTSRFWISLVSVGGMSPTHHPMELFLSFSISLL